MTDRLLMERTGEEICHGQMIKAIAGPHRGTSWRFHALQRVADGHVVHMSRAHRAGRVHRTFHPGVFGLTVDLEITWTHRILGAAGSIRRKVDDYLLAGVFALVPLAAFEYFHLADHLFEVLGMSEH